MGVHRRLAHVHGPSLVCSSVEYCPLMDSSSSSEDGISSLSHSSERLGTLASTPIQCSLLRICLKKRRRRLQKRLPKMLESRVYSDSDDSIISLFSSFHFGVLTHTRARV